MVFLTKKTAKAVNTLLFVAMLALAWADLIVEAAKAKDGKAAGADKEDKSYFVKFNGVLWVSFLFLYLALSAAWMIVTDNAPDTAKDSILYARFLTQNFNQKAH